MNIVEPTLLIDKNRVARNIDSMLERARMFQAVLRPHFKTHQSAEIGEMFKERGVEAIAVSSVSMAEFFAGHGWNDILIAFPVNLLQMEQLDVLAGKINLSILVDSLYSMKKVNAGIKKRFGVFIKIDTGYGRSGLAHNDIEIEEIVTEITKNSLSNLRGFLTHAGHTYEAKGVKEIEKIVKDSATQLTELKQKFPGTIISWGDTPSCSLSENLSEFDELRPGNFVYFDAMQYHIGSCKLDEIAVAVACPVVSVFPQRGELIIYGGAVHLSKEFIAADNNFKLFGYLVKLNDGRWQQPINGAWVSSLSQEHGIIKMSKKDLEKFKPGDLIGVVPVHSCLTANLLRNKYLIH